jgi:signal transduction histidine kinase
MEYSSAAVGGSVLVGDRVRQARRGGPPRRSTDADAVLRTAVPQQGQHEAKLTDLGARIARVAHELNAPLSLISGSLDNLAEYVGALIQYVRLTGSHIDADPDLAQSYAGLAHIVENAPTLMKICREGTVRLHHVIDELKCYTRRGPTDGPLARVDLGKVLHEAIALAVCSRSEPARVYEDIPALPHILGSVEPLSRVFINVIGNALDAVATSAHPGVWVRARPDMVARATRQPRWIAVRIWDNGPGVALANRQRIFDPFFTTKSRGVGLGLGLAIAKEIVESHGGTIALAAGNGGGAEFVIQLPIREPEHE